MPDKKWPPPPILTSTNGLDWLEEPPVEPPKELTTAQKRVQALQRERLFHHGSDFKPTSRSEIVGIDNILGEIDEIIHWLKHSEEYGKHRSRLQPGVIFAGKPGMGKTLVSRWVATASDALFINVRDFNHEGALFTDADIRDLFDYAREARRTTNRPIVLFWDEFENSAYERGDSQTTPEQRSVVSQLTAELDGIHGKNEGIVLIGCTNYLHAIDAALVRRGRMGVQIEFHAPDRHGKELILRYYLGQMATADGIDIDTLSYFFPKQNTAADIEEACVEAWRHAVRRSIDTGGAPILAQEDLVKVFIKQLVGPPTTFTLPEAERRSIAIHECGHAIVALSYRVPLRLITVQPGKESLGRVMTDDVMEYIGTVPEMLKRMKIGMGGIAAERITGLAPMTGASGDISQVTGTAEELVSHLCVGSRVGTIDPTALNRGGPYSALVPGVSERLTEAADLDVGDLVDDAERDAERALARVGKDNLIVIATKVDERGTMTGREFRDLFIEVCGFEPELGSPRPEL